MKKIKTMFYLTSWGTALFSILNFALYDIWLKVTLDRIANTSEGAEGLGGIGVGILLAICLIATFICIGYGLVFNTIGTICAVKKKFVPQGVFSLIEGLIIGIYTLILAISSATSTSLVNQDIPYIAFFFVLSILTLVCSIVSFILSIKLNKLNKQERF